MKKITTQILKFAIDKVRRNRFIQNIFESPFDLNNFQKSGVFQDIHGNNHQLYKELRDKIKPGWQRMVSGKKPDASSRNIQKMKSNSLITVEKLQSILNTFGKSIQGSDILEIGCHSGSVSYAMAELGASKVIGTEFNGYKVSSVSDTPNLDETILNEVSEFLKAIRLRLQDIYYTKGNIEFTDDDICNTTLKESSYDIICSWDVLEHLHRPQEAFNNISKLLKKGGISIHHYNPFFCLNGGHSMCTLDFLWGHVRLNEMDFIDYINTIRPNETERATAFYKNGVNRMTLKDIKNIVEETEMQLLGIIPFVKEQHLRMVDEKTLQQAKNNYPHLSLIDLVAPLVLVVTQRPH